MANLRFRNLDGSGPHPLSSVFRWAVLDRLSGRRKPSTERSPAPSVPLDPVSLQTPPAPGEGLRLVWLGHASWLVQMDGQTLLIDPILRDHIFPRIPRLGPVPLPPDQLPKIDATLITHGHYDHLDAPSVRAARAPAICGTGLGRSVGGAAPVLAELGWWQSQMLGSLRITFVPSQHWHRRRFDDLNQALWGGYVIEGSGGRVYHSGDTAAFEGFAEIGRRCGPVDAALLPIGAYSPGWFMEKQHMNPEQAVQAYVDLGAREFFAMHWGTFQLTDEPTQEPAQRVRAEWARRGLPPERLHVLATGETWLAGGRSSPAPKSVDRPPSA